MEAITFLHINDIKLNPMRNPSKITILLCMFLAFACKKENNLPFKEEAFDYVYYTDNWEGIPPITQEELSSFRSFSSIDEIENQSLYRITENLPATYEIPNFTPVHSYGQGNKNSCAAWAIGYGIMSYYKARKNNFNYNQSILLSPDYIYNKLVNKNEITCNNGMKINQIRDVLINDGVCSIFDLPLEKNIKGEVCTKLTKLTTFHNIQAENNKIIDILYYNVKMNKDSAIKDMKRILLKNYPIAISIPIDEDFKDVVHNSNPNYTIKSHIGRWIPISENNINKAGHMIIIKGFDDDKNAWIIQNSWGKTWRNKGCSYLDYNYLHGFLSATASVFGYGIPYVVKMRPDNLSEKIGVLLYSNINEDAIVGGTSNTGIYGGIATGIELENWSGLKLAKFTHYNHSRLELNLNNVLSGLPNQLNESGTFEIMMYVKKAYSYSNYNFYDNQNTVSILTSDLNGADTHWKGSMAFTANNNGTLQFRINSTKYSSSPPYILTVQNTNFRFNQWHRLGISYGSQGMKIMLDGLVVAHNNITQVISNGGGQTLQNDRPTIGEAVSYFPWGNRQYTNGFEGYVYKIRTSSNQSDFKLNL